MNNQTTKPVQHESRHFLKKISSKLVIAVLGAVILPFVGLVYFVDTQIDTRLKINIVNQSLLNLAGDLAHELNTMMKKRNSDLLIMSAGIPPGRAIQEHLGQVESDRYNSLSHQKTFFTDQPPTRETKNFSWRNIQTETFNRFVQLRKVYDLILLLDQNGKVVVCNNINAEGEKIDFNLILHLFSHTFKEKPWFTEALKREIFRVDQHVSDLIPKEYIKDIDTASHHHIGFAVPVKHPMQKNKSFGVIYALVNWKNIQQLIDVPRIKAYFSGLVKDKEPSPYAWIWGADANTILAHQDRSLYGETVAGAKLNLPQMVEDARSSHFGLYREYSYQNNKKNAAYFHCEGPEPGTRLGGFGWVVGVGIDNRDIYAMAGQLRRLLYTSTGVVIIIVILWTLLIARRTTRPILSLQKHMRKVSQGNLDTQITLDRGDEIGDLAADFNQMIFELKEKRAQLIKAEKSAAWREMAQQISHDIKNTLTPLKLSVGLLKQAVKDDSPEYKQILQHTLELIDHQTKNLREIAINFFEFTGGRKSVAKRCDIGSLITEVTKLNGEWARELNITIEGLEGLKDSGIYVLSDEMKLQRVLTNIVANAFQAMPDGGTLSISLNKADNFAVMRIKDSGVGIPDEVRDHLFEPYFTTRSQGTGLGLAIAKRIIDESGGTIVLDKNGDNGGRGTSVCIRLPLAK